MPVSPHGPASPVGNLAAAHVCAGMPNFQILEFSYGEVPELCRYQRFLRATALRRYENSKIWKFGISGADMRGGEVTDRTRRTVWRDGHLDGFS